MAYLLQLVASALDGGTRPPSVFQPGFRDLGCLEIIGGGGGRRSGGAEQGVDA